MRLPTLILTIAQNYLDLSSMLFPFFANSQLAMALTNPPAKAALQQNVDGDK